MLHPIVPIITPMQHNSDIDYYSLIKLIKTYSKYNINNYLLFGIDAEVEKLDFNEKNNIINTIYQANNNANLILDISAQSINEVLDNCLIARTLNINHTMISLADLISNNHYDGLAAVERIAPVCKSIIVNIATSVYEQDFQLDVLRKIVALPEVIAIADSFEDKQKYNFYARNIAANVEYFIAINHNNIDMHKMSSLYALFPELFNINMAPSFYQKHKYLIETLNKNNHNIILKYCLAARSKCHNYSRVPTPKWPAQMALGIKRALSEIESEIAKHNTVHEEA